MEVSETNWERKEKETFSISGILVNVDFVIKEYMRIPNAKNHGYN